MRRRAMFLALAVATTVSRASDDAIDLNQIRHNLVQHAETLGLAYGPAYVRAIAGLRRHNRGYLPEGAVRVSDMQEARDMQQFQTQGKTPPPELIAAFKQHVAKNETIIASDLGLTREQYARFRRGGNSLLMREGTAGMELPGPDGVISCDERCQDELAKGEGPLTVTRLALAANIPSRHLFTVNYRGGTRDGVSEIWCYNPVSGAWMQPVG